VVHRGNLSALKNRSGVENIFLAVQAHHCRDVVNVPRKILDCSEVGLDELRRAAGPRWISRQ
jgi:hypothetical protein